MNLQGLALPILLFVGLGLMLFFSTRKQRAAAEATRTMLASITPGARVMTTSGLHGTVTAVADDTLELEIAPGVRTTWVRAAVREVVVAAPTVETDGTGPEVGGASPVDDTAVRLDKRTDDLG